MFIMLLLYGSLTTVIMLVGEAVLLYKKDTSQALVKFVTYLVYMLFIFGFVYFGLPSRNLLSIMIGSSFLAILYILLSGLKASFDDIEDSYVFNVAHVACSVVIGLVFAVGIVGEIHSNMSVKASYDSISTVQKKSTKAPTFKRNETPVAISPKTILNKTHKSISDVPNNSYYKIDSNLQAQYYKGKPVYIIPIEYQGYFTSRKARYIPGYFMIDATNPNSSPKFISKRMNYSNSSYFGQNIMRVIYRHYPNWLTADGSKPLLEVDDNGTPYWVETMYKPESLSHRVDYSELRVAVANAETGDTNLYTLNKLPKFVDEGITSDVAKSMNTTFGKYEYGFWNAHFGQTNLKKPTNNGPDDGVTSVFNKNGTISYFSDFTNQNSDSDSAVGYSMINARTGHLDYYKTSGIMDSNGAIENANQNYKAQKWHTKMPVLYNVSGHPTWVMSVLDSTGAMRGYYYLDAADQSIYASGANANLALDSYQQALVDGGGTVGNTDSKTTKRVVGVVDRMLVVSDNNKVVFSLKGSNIIYTVNTDDFPKAQLLKPGDTVSFKANIINSHSIGNVTKFSNQDFK